MIDEQPSGCFFLAQYQLMKRRFNLEVSDGHIRDSKHC